MIAAHQSHSWRVAAIEIVLVPVQLQATAPAFSSTGTCDARVCVCCVYVVLSRTFTREAGRIKCVRASWALPRRCGNLKPATHGVLAAS